MPVILVVDDSRADRALIGHLLQEEPLDWIVDFAASAEEALVRLQELAVDVVVTDMMMPGMDGLALLKLVRRQYRGVSVILTTGQGNEVLAVQALNEGAASYVPKAELPARLGETIKQVLQLTKSERNYDQLIDNEFNVRIRYQLNNDIELIAPLVSLVQRTISHVRLCSHECCQRIGVAFDEALINAIYHGSLELPREHLTDVRSQLREGGSIELIEQRRAESPFCERRVFIEVSLSQREFRVSIRDEGPGFDHVAAKKFSELSEAIGTDSPRGLVLIHSHMDAVEFNQKGNEITMVKRREAESGEQDPLPL